MDRALSQPSMNALPPPTSSINPRLALPDKFDGNPTNPLYFSLGSGGTRQPSSLCGKAHAQHVDLQLETGTLHT